MSDEILLPFKPFTFEEVAQITGISSKMIDSWCNTVLTPMRGQTGTIGWDYDQTFAAFVGWKYMAERSDVYRAGCVIVYLRGVGVGTIEQNLLVGNNFPAIYKDDSGKWQGTLVPAPDKTLGQRLRLDKLLTEFRVGVARVFPNG